MRARTLHFIIQVIIVGPNVIPETFLGGFERTLFN